MKDERGESLVEVVVAVAIFALASAALLACTIVAAHRFGPNASQAALRQTLAREMRIAVDALKYRGGSIAPASVATTVPMPGVSPAAAHLSIAATTLSNGSTLVTLHASLDAIPNDTATLTAVLPQPVPLPSSTIPASGAAPQ